MIDVEVLANESSREQYGSRSRRWSEILIGRTENGRYLGVEIGRSIEPGEVDRSRHVLSEDPWEIIRMLERRRRSRSTSPATLTVVALDALEAAAEADPTFAEAIGDVLYFQRLDPEHHVEGDLPTWSERVEAQPDVEHGAPVIRGTQVLVEAVLLGLGAGKAPADVALELGIEPADVAAACNFAASTLGKIRAATGLQWRRRRRKPRKGV